MKKLLTAKSLSLLMLLSLFGGKAEARHNDDYVVESRDCCFGGCYECGCNPLYCGAWDLQIHGGVNPITWRNRGDVLGVSCAISATTPVVALFEVPKFKTLFKTPWIVGGQIGYHWSDNARVYLEFNYSQAKAKSDVVFSTVLVPGTLASTLNFTKYKVFDAYVGARYYWDRWCDRVAFFLGAKVGLTHHKSADVNVAAVLGELSNTFLFANAFRSNNVVSGGADFGFDICFCGNWSFVIQGAVLASCGPRSGILHVADVVTPTLGVTDLIIGGIGSELRFPVTAGIRYSF